MRWKYEIKEDSRRRTFCSEAARTERLQADSAQAEDNYYGASDYFTTLFKLTGSQRFRRLHHAPAVLDTAAGAVIAI
jgi:hypothetical protein